METLPAGRADTAVVPGSAPASRRRCGKRVAQGAGAVAAMAVLAGTAVTNHAALAASVATLGHLQWIWIPTVIMLESASMAALAGMQRRLLAAGGTSVRVRSMLATTLAANALSVSVPLAGPELGTAFAFRRFTGQGADAPLAVWSLVVGGVMSTAAGGLLVVGGGLSDGRIPFMVAAMATGLTAAAAVAAAVAAARRPRVRSALEKPAAWIVRRGARLLHRPAEQPSQVIRSWAGRLESLRLPRSGWITVTTLALVNWLADAAVFAVSIQAVGAAIPWHVLLLAYGSGVGAQTLNITPGGLGITEGTLSLTLVAAGLRASQALASVLLYRLVSFWLIASAGWLTLLWLRRHRRSVATPGRQRRYPAPMPACHRGAPKI
ncbi:MAG TPA: YbhN family protein [Trebonia sp.]